MAPADAISDAAASRARASDAAMPGGATAEAGAAPVRPEPWWGLGLVTSGTVPPVPDEPAQSESTVPEEERFCKQCRNPVGRGYGGAPGRATGYCTKCGLQFDFTNSRVGQLIANRYTVKRKLGAGAFGAALLADDRNLGTDVVLKDLTQSMASTGQLERDALVGLRHDSIVRIYDYQPDGPYLVLEYVRGTALSVRADDRLEVILGHGLQILQALDYLHARGLLHIDVKPENIIRFGEQSADGPRDRVRLIDFGAVWKLGVPGPVTSYTVAYAPPKSDSEHLSPTAGFDLFCLGTTLQALCRRHLRDPSAPGVAALDRLLRRATDIAVPRRRFTSARQFAEQLSGVIRQVVASAPNGRLVTRPSVLFGSMGEPLHGGLGAPRPLSDWTTAIALPDRGFTMPAPFTTPTPAEVSAAMPAPLADPDDPDLTRGCQAELVACRTALRRGDLDSATRSLDATGLPKWFWIHAWYAGLIALSGGDEPAATARFRTVGDTLPGDLIPVLALGFTAEIRGDLPEALLQYETAADTAPALTAAGFGLARVHLRAGRRADAVRAAERLAEELRVRELRFEDEARVAVVRLLAAATETDLPAEADLSRAEALLAELRLPAEAKIGLETEIRYGRSVATGDWRALSDSMPALAKLAGTRPEFVALIDQANRLRPPIEWWWRRTNRQRRVRPPAAA